MADTIGLPISRALCVVGKKFSGKSASFDEMLIKAKCQKTLDCGHFRFVNIMGTMRSREKKIEQEVPQMTRWE
jgi:hypothetical protein